MQVIDCSRSDAIEVARDAISRGELVVLPTDTVYGIGADPRNKAAVDSLLTAKGRGRDKPSPVLVASIAQAEALASSIPAVARALMAEFWPGALTIVLPSRQLGWDLGETDGTVAVRMPADRCALALLEASGPLAVSSANRTAERPAATVRHAARQLGEKVAVYLDGGECGGGTPSTIVGFDGEAIRVLREGAIPRADLARFGKVV